MKQKKQVNAKFELNKIQKEISDWAYDNFNRFNTTKEQFNSLTNLEPLLGMVEELGELAHARLKARQNIRGSLEEHKLEEIDALGDLFIFFLDYCSRREYDAETILTTTWSEVKKRQWRNDPVKGGMVNG